MRIIAGALRGRTILSPPSDKTRPITDRAKQSLFDALQDCFTGGVILDCFAGTGSLGLECLSRGAKRAIFVERDRGALRALKDNLTALALADRAIVLPIDAYTMTNSLSTQHSALSTDKLTIAFLDPPYAHMATGHDRHKIDRLIQQLAASCLVDGGLISLRHPAAVSLEPAALGTKIVREFKYGDMAITWLAKA